jgi:16S rRNA processing protein RimM
VYFPRSLSDNDAEAMTWSAIVGFQLVDAIYNKVVGEITAVDDSTLNVLFEVTTTDGRDILVPASEELIQDVDTQQRTIYINIPEGILDL